MPRLSWFTILACLILSGLGLLAYQGWHYLVGPEVAKVPILSAGHQELAWFSPAISSDGWERLVAALKSLEKDWPKSHPDLPTFKVSFEEAFLDQTASVPQIAVYFAGFENAKLWIRWYKLGGEVQQSQWLEKLQKRGRLPLAIIGGDSSERALTTARELKKIQENSNRTAPLFLVTNATLVRFDESNMATDLTDPKWPKFMDVYKGRMFRFCFTNEHIAQAVLDFVQDNPQIWPGVHHDPFILAGLAGQGNSLNCLGILAGTDYVRSVHLTALAWDDDRYSQDLANRIWRLFARYYYHGDIFKAVNHYRWHYINYSVGGFYGPNPREQEAVSNYLSQKQKENRAGQHQLLAMPTGVQQARRFLRTLCRRAPNEIGDLIVITGDSVNFNNVYRDGDLEWNVLDMPVPLVFFCHRNPVSETAGFRPRAHSAPAAVDRHEEGGFHTTGTEDLLLLRDAIEAFVQAAWSDGNWSAEADAVRDRLRNLRWREGRVQGAGSTGLPLFDEDGDRSPHTGEHIVWLQPVKVHARTLPRASLSVWRIVRPLADSKTWKRIGEPIIVNYSHTAEIGRDGD